MAKKDPPNPFKRVRTQNKLSQVELANLFNTTQTSISDWETGKTLPSYENLVRFSKTFNVSTDYLLGLSETKQPMLKVSTDPFAQAQHALHELDREQLHDMQIYIEGLKARFTHKINTFNDF